MSGMIRRERIELRAGWAVGSVLPAIGWRLGDWAAHASAGMPGRFSLTLLPLGLCLPTDWATFEREGDAILAMRAIVRMRNDWHRIVQADLTLALKSRLQAICRHSGALAVAPVGFAQVADQDFLGNASDRLNGYVAPRETVH